MEATQGREDVLISASVALATEMLDLDPLWEEGGKEACAECQKGFKSPGKGCTATGRREAGDPGASWTQEVLGGKQEMSKSLSSPFPRKKGTVSTNN